MEPHDPPVESLSAFVAGLRFEDLPPALVAKAKVHLLDTLGAALAGTRSAEAALARAVLAAEPGGTARLWGTPDRASPRDAAPVNGEAGQPSRLSDGLGRDWMLDRASLKPYASCHGAHSAVDAVGDILDEAGCDGAEVEAGLAAYAEDRRRSPAVLATMERVRLAVDPAQRPLDEPVGAVLFRDGRRCERVVPRATGSRERPLAPGAADAKFEALAAMALPRGGAAALAEAVHGLDRLPDCAILDGLLAGDGPARPVFR